MKRKFLELQQLEDLIILSFGGTESIPRILCVSFSDLRTILITQVLFRLFFFIPNSAVISVPSHPFGSRESFSYRYKMKKLCKTVRDQRNFLNTYFFELYDKFRTITSSFDIIIKCSKTFAYLSSQGQCYSKKRK